LFGGIPLQLSPWIDWQRREAGLLMGSPAFFVSRCAVAIFLAWQAGMIMASDEYI
jgi:hypothetical protein